MLGVLTFLLPHPRLMCAPMKRNVLRLLQKTAQEILYDAVKDFDFAGFLANRGLLRTQQRKKGVWIFKWTLTDYLPGEEYEEAIRQLNHLKRKIQSAIQTRTPDKYLICMSYAFPSIASNKAFSRYVKQNKRAKRALGPDYMAIAVTAAELARRVGYRLDHPDRQ